MSRFAVASCLFAWCKREKLVGHTVGYKRTGSPCVARGPGYLCHCVQMWTSSCVWHSYGFFFLTIQFFFPRAFPFSVVVIYRAERPRGQLKHLRMCAWSKLMMLNRRMKPQRWWKVRIQRRTWVKSTSRGRKGAPSLYCQHLIRSGIKHFVPVQREQRGRDTGWMLLCLLGSEPLL